MDYKKKYEETLKRAKEQLDGAKAFNYDNEQIAHDIRTIVYNIFPELNEPDAWLEKQSEQKPYGQMEKCVKCQFVFTGYCNGTCILKNKVEPKFKVGDWVVCCDYEPEQIINITTDMYEMSNGDIRPFYMIDDNPYIRPWTIQDAKDGDVLATKDNRICIFDNTVEEGKHPFAYCGLSIYGFEVYDRTLPFTHLDVYPATKEQRDLLFTKMREVGYEWDAVNKQLKKIEKY